MGRIGEGASIGGTHRVACHFAPLDAYVHAPVGAAVDSSFDASVDAHVDAASARTPVNTSIEARRVDEQHACGEGSRVAKRQETAR
jgi:hypothetical protein